MIALTGIPVIETERLRLRGPKASDFESFAAFLQSDRAAFVGGTVPRVQAWRAFGHLTGHWVLRGYSMFILADKATDAPLGMSGPWFPEGWPEREIGWSIWNAQAEGKGLAFEAAMAARDWAYRILGWTTAISLIVAGNAKSEALARRMGCVYEGEFTHEVYGQSRIFRHPAARDA
jgi:RimJ/RimL family protein N-acetyltransferase